LRHVVERGELWTLALNRNQNVPGKSVLALNRHCERVQDLTAQEWTSLHPYTERITAALDELFAPDLYNFAFLMNFDAHVHLHVVPRYASPVEWRDETYADEHYGSLFGKEQRPASEEALDELAETLKNAMR
jgi:diadenosine tetraphosphate (Ap4A) HIT family hydrolase